MSESLLGGATYTHNGTFTTGEGDISNIQARFKSKYFSTDLTGYLIQSINTSTSLQNRTVYEVGTNYYYYIQGRPSGQGSIQHLVGPNCYSLWNQLSDWSCKPQDLEITVDKSTKKYECEACGGGGDSGPEVITFTGGYLNSINVGITAGEVAVTSNLGFTFLDVQK